VTCSGDFTVKAVTEQTLETGEGGEGLFRVVCCFVPTRYYYPESFGEHPNDSEKTENSGHECSRLR
jgi:hypothetical protein